MGEASSFSPNVIEFGCLITWGIVGREGSEELQFSFCIDSVVPERWSGSGLEEPEGTYLALFCMAGTSCAVLTRRIFPVSRVLCRRGCVRQRTKICEGVDLSGTVRHEALRLGIFTGDSSSIRGMVLVVCMAGSNSMSSIKEWDLCTKLRINLASSLGSLTVYCTLLVLEQPIYNLLRITYDTL